MVPLHDDNPTRNTPYITYGLIGLNVVIFLYEVTLGPLSIIEFYKDWGVVPVELNSNFNAEWSTLLSTQFVHGGWLHIAGNMLYLWIFGNNIEDELGPFRFLGFYLACGVTAALFQGVFDPASEVPIVGASGAIAGVMGAYIVRFPNAKITTLIPLGFFITTIQIPALVFLGFWFVQQAFYSVASLGTASFGGGVAYLAHAGGFIAGIGLGPALGLFNRR